MASLFQEFRLKDVVLRNRIAVSPMCQYSSDNGFPSDWHFVHLGSRAVGGAGLVMVEASAVTPEGRISPADSGIYLDDHVEPFARISRFLKQQALSPASNSPTPVARPAPASRGKATSTSRRTKAAGTPSPHQRFLSAEISRRFHERCR
jgi:NADH:flavin oxidoreductase / NADH oxidase family